MIAKGEVSKCAYIRRCAYCFAVAIVGPLASLSSVVYGDQLSCEGWLAQLERCKETGSNVSDSALVPEPTPADFDWNSYDYRKQPIQRTPFIPDGTNTDASLFIDVDNDGTSEYLGIGMTEDYHWALLENNQRVGEQSPDLFRLFRRDPSCYWKECLLEDEKIVINNTECLHARKSIAGDFNNDGFLDVVVGCHGWDRKPFPGGYVVMLINKKGRAFEPKTLPFKGYWHSIASADFNDDGYLDLILADAAWKGQSSVSVYLNDGELGFSEDKNFIKTGWGKAPKASTVSVPDFNDDGLFDLFLGGKGFAYFILNDGSNHFSLSKKVEFEVSNSFPHVYDVLTTNNKAYLLRIEKDWKGTLIEEVNLADMQTTVIFEEICPSQRVWDDPCAWQRWLYTEIDSTGKRWMVSDNKHVNPQKFLLDD